MSWLVKTASTSRESSRAFAGSECHFRCDHAGFWLFSASLGFLQVCCSSLHRLDRSFQALWSFGKTVRSLDAESWWSSLRRYSRIGLSESFTAKSQHTDHISPYASPPCCSRAADHPQPFEPVVVDMASLATVSREVARLSSQSIRRNVYSRGLLSVPTRINCLDLRKFNTKSKT